MKMKNKPNGLAVAVLAAMLGACGGGGGSSPSTADDRTGSSEEGAVATLSGTVVKGLIRDGQVTAVELDADGKVVRQVGTATTGMDGRYHLEISEAYGGGPIQVTVSAGPATQMKCDVPAGCGTRTDDIADTDTQVDFGEWYRPGELAMSALVGNAAGGATISVNVTPFTHLAAQRAREMGALTAQAVDAANSEVGNLLGGIDILRTRPVDITVPGNIDDAEGAAYATLAAAVASLADTSQGKPDLKGVLDVLAGSFSGGQMQVSDPDNDPSRIAFYELLDKADDVLLETGRNDTSGVIDAMMAMMRDAADGIVDPEPGTTVAGGTGLEKVKALVSELRTWGNVLEQEMNARGSAFLEQTTLAWDAAESARMVLVDGAFSDAFSAVLDYAAGGAGGSDLAAYWGFSSGTISREGDIIVLSGQHRDGGAIDLRVQLPPDGTSTDVLDFGIQSARFRSEWTDADITAGTVRLTLDTPYSVDWSTLAGGPAIPTGIQEMEVDLNVELTQKSTGWWDWIPRPLEVPVTFGGRVTAQLKVIQGAAGEIEHLIPRNMDMGGTARRGDDSMALSATANFTNVDYVAGPYGRPELDRIGVGGVIEGDIGVNFELQLAEMPKATVNISGARTAYRSGNATVTLAYGTRRLEIRSLFDESWDATGSVTFTSQDGAELTLFEGDFDTQGVLKYNGVEYGTVTIVHGVPKFSYSDGSFDYL